VLETFEIEPTAPQKGSVIWMHGLGATNHDFDAVVPLLEAPDCRFVFPAAPLRSITINGGAQMPAWYDIVSTNAPPLRENAEHVAEASAAIEALIDREAERGVQRSRIALVGFSQGGAMALHVGLRSQRRLAGVAVLSAYLLMPDKFDEHRTSQSADMPFLFGHGTQDPVVPLSLGRAAYERLSRAGYAAAFGEYEMQHAMCLDEVKALKEWLRKALS